MLRYTLRRMLIMIPTLLVISFITFVIIQLPPGDFLDDADRRAPDARATRRRLEKVEFLRKQYGLDKPFVEQYGSGRRGRVGGFSADPGRPRLLVRVRPAGGRHRRRAAAAHLRRHSRLDPVHLAGGVPDRRLLGDPPVQLGRPRAHLHRLPRPRDAQLPARAGPDVFRSRKFGSRSAACSRPDILERAVELGQGRARCSSTCGSR